MKLIIIVARAKNGVIGRGNALPWRLPEDLAHFRRTTLGHPVIMGRNTWDSIGKPLPGRRNIVVTRNARWHAAGVERASSLDQAMALCADNEMVFVIGGAALFADALPKADSAIVTEIGRDVDGDTFFAPLDANQWVVISREEHVAAGPEALPYAFVHYARREPAAASSSRPASTRTNH